MKCPWAVGRTEWNRSGVVLVGIRNVDFYGAVLLSGGVLARVVLKFARQCGSKELPWEGGLPDGVNLECILGGLSGDNRGCCSDRCIISVCFV
jgi:hypothetical protein